MSVQAAIQAIRNINNDNELRSLFEAIKLQRQFLAVQTIRSITVGDTVQFNARGRTITGEVMKVNRKNVKVKEGGYTTWNVPANMLTVVETA